MGIIAAHDDRPRSALVEPVGTAAADDDRRGVSARAGGIGASRPARRGPRAGGAAVAFLVLCAGLAAQSQPSPAPAEQRAAADRAAERLRALRVEADALLAQEHSLLNELRRLEVTRQLRAEELRGLTKEAAQLDEELQETARHVELLRRTRDAQEPAWRARVTELYKLGRGGYLRLLLGLQDVRRLGQAYRAVSALAERDRELARAYQSTRQSLERAREALVHRREEVETLRQRAAAARAAADRAVRDQTALIAALDTRRDLNAQLTGELQAAGVRLHAAVDALGTGALLLPIRPFRGALDWPAAGRVLSPFRGAAGPRRDGIEIAAAPGTPVVAVHDGVVAYAAPFAGFGTLVILDHGGGSHSLYGHLERRDVERGDRVGRGATVGLVGADPSGRPGLYFELRVDGGAVDPLQWLKRQP